MAIVTSWPFLALRMNGGRDATKEEVRVAGSL